MHRPILRVLIAAGVFAIASASPLAAQTAATVSGYVTSGARPVAGARVRVDDLDIERITDADGRYSFVVPSRSVRGQVVRVAVSMSDRRARYRPTSAPIRLTGGPIERNFVLVPVDDVSGISSDSGGPAGARQEIVARSSAISNLLEGTAGGPVDVASSLAGRIPGLRVSTASVLGGSALLTYRGPRSILGTNQPLYVVDGVVLDNTVYTSAAQRFGLGGFDYGSAVSDLDVSSIASVSFVTGTSASLQYGSRGANGVVEIHTKTGDDGLGFSVFSTAQHVAGTVGRLPKLQNSFGQGLNGQFAFFDGRGGGINDNVDQNWGPRLDGSAVSQASYTEAGQADVRLWSPNSNNVRNYFLDAPSTNVIAGVQAHGDYGSIRVALGNRNAYGISPSNHQLRRNGSLSANLRPSSQLELSASGFLSETKTNDAPGTGFNEGNPVSQFMRMGRQVDTDSLRLHVRDAAGDQVSWNYSGHNNPYFATAENNNLSQRHHAAGGGSATFALAPWLKATGQAGVDYVRDHRLFSIGSDWMGGFPSYSGQGDFSKGGSEGNEIFVQQTTSSLRLDASRSLATARWTIGIGASTDGLKQRIRTLGVDSIRHVPSAGAPDTARLPALLNWSSHARSTAVFGETGLSFANGVALRGGLREVWSAMVPGQHVPTLFPSAEASYDLARAWKSLRNNRLISGATLRASVFKDANNLDPYEVQTSYAGRTPTGSVAPNGSDLLVADPGLTPEKTLAWQFGGDLALRPGRISLGGMYYHERTSGVILPILNPNVGLILATNAADMTNDGVEGQASARFGDGEIGLGWDIAANASLNWNEVSTLYGSAASVPLAPTQWNLSVEARRGLPLGSLMGRRLLRDGSGALILRDGLPVPDSLAGPQLLGSVRPRAVLGFHSALRYRWVTIAATADGRLGGTVYSATNRWGTYSGTLAETAVRPDTGLVIAGVDAVTRTANVTHVSAQDYYHALANVEQPWVYSASYVKLREARVSLAIPLSHQLIPFQSASVSIVGRNLYMWAKAPNIDPETVLSTRQVQGLEIGQLPATRSVGFEISITP